MNILSMLVRLQDALGRNDLIDQMVLSPQSLISQVQSVEDINLVVGYTSSPKSQTALDLTLWIAHQTRLVTRKSVTVQVVYVIAPQPHAPFGIYPPDSSTPTKAGRRATKMAHSTNSARKHQTLTQPYPEATVQKLADVFHQHSPEMIGAIAGSTTLPAIAHSAPLSQREQFEQADHILWQARCLADEWRGSLKTHLRFGQVAQELRGVVQEESASLLLLGCNSPKNSLIRELGTQFPCPVLGIPSNLDNDL